MKDFAWFFGAFCVSALMTLAFMSLFADVEWLPASKLVIVTAAVGVFIMLFAWLLHLCRQPYWIVYFALSMGAGAVAASVVDRRDTFYGSLIPKANKRHYYIEEA